MENISIMICVATIVLLSIVAICINRRTNEIDRISFRETLDLTGLPIITMMMGGNKINLVLDTGSTTTVINSKFLEQYNIGYDIISKTKMLGVDGIQTPVNKGMLKVVYKDKEYEFPATIKDMSKAFDHLKKTKGVNINGLLGSDFFENYKYIIDFAEYIAYSK